jgi:hypothetical protein
VFARTTPFYNVNQELSDIVSCEICAATKDAELSNFVDLILCLETNSVLLTMSGSANFDSIPEMGLFLMMYRREVQAIVFFVKLHGDS